MVSACAGKTTSVPSDASSDVDGAVATASGGDGEAPGSVIIDASADETSLDALTVPDVSSPGAGDSATMPDSPSTGPDVNELGDASQTALDSGTGDDSAWIGDASSDTSIDASRDGEADITGGPDASSDSNDPDASDAPLCTPGALECVINSRERLVCNDQGSGWSAQVEPCYAPFHCVAGQCV
jgi:hypothetical protein